MISSSELAPVRRENWKLANRRLVGKMLQEFLYEKIIEAEKEEMTENGLQSLKVRLGNIHYTFEAKTRFFESYHVYENTIEKNKDGGSLALSASDFLIELQQHAPITSETAGHLLKEYYHTLVADCHLLDKQTTAGTLAEMDYAELEGEMSGHPWITYNKGRIGFNYKDYLDYAPEHKRPITLFWIAVHESAATFQSTEEVSYERLMQQELLDNELHTFRSQVEKAGAKPEEYFFVPVHKWQWEHNIIPLFADYLADARIIPLGYSNDAYLPQQSIRTFVNIDEKQKYHVKLPISILNTLVYRGLPSERTTIAPKVTDWVKSIKSKDSFLRDTCNIGLLGEVATIDVSHDSYHALDKAPYQYLELLGTVWRESIYNEIDEDEHPITLSALLHKDSKDKPFVQELMERSGLSPEEWIQKLCAAILPPLLHYLYQYGTVFSPHGQNTIVSLKDYVPHRLIMKDFVDDVNISDQPLPELTDVPDDLKRVLRSEGPEGLVQFIFTGLFICHFRYLADILDEADLVYEKDFWSFTAQSIEAYQQQFPESADRFELFNLFRPKMTKLCLNRNRMLDYGYADGDDRPHASEHGTVDNALFFMRTKEVHSNH
ncbi:IucA/IucC family protein [Alteribacillus sp. HJP-4]|uniref:IucA/IucC family protein n=1 Tax=Alteribacillus sp. HJP-4 TaxID=2775394 RepID=UPI0035CCF5A8